MHKEGAKQMREEVILEIVGNQEESKKGEGLNWEDWMTSDTVEK